LGKYEVTIKEYSEFCDKTGRERPYEEFKLDLIPATAVSWWDAIAYCNWLSTKEGLPKAYDSNGNLLDLSGNTTTDPSKVAGYRLPTEAEWEYAARGGKYSRGYKYAGSNSKDEVAWHEDNNRDIYHEVGLKLPNGLELFDMTGNVWEWCSDGWDIYTYEPVTNPFFVGDRVNRVLRGGSLVSNDHDLHLSRRIFSSPDQAYSDAGFRVCKTVIEQDLPYVSKLGGLEGTVLNTQNTFAWSGIIMEGEIANYDYRMDQSEWTSCELDDSYIWGNYSRGKHTFEVRAKSNNGIYSRVVSWEFFAVELIEVSSGSFAMGDTFGGGYSEELPISLVILDYDYNLGKCEVTFDEYDAFCEATDRSKPNDQGWGRGSRPVINVTWWDAIAYCNWLNEMASLPKAYNKNGEFLDRDGNLTSDPSKVVGYRLPTEAEWEYAARGGNKSNGYKYAGSSTVGDVAWYDSNSGGRTQEVGQKAFNELGIYDMSGNVWEWCSDLFSIYKAKTLVNPFKSYSSSSSRVIRGGSWSNNETYLRVSCRLSKEHEDAINTLGFRICRTDIDIRIPIIERVDGPNGKVLEPDVTFVWNGSDYDGLVAVYQYRKDSGEWEELFELKDSYTWRNVSGGSHTFEVRAVDNDGFCSEPVSWFFWRVIEGDKVFVERGSNSIEETLLGTRILDHDFTIGRYEVTISEFRKFCRDTAREMPNVDLVSSDSCPVFNVSWWDAIAYCNWLSDSEELPRAYNNAGQLLDCKCNVTKD
jgi:formylglycine-generating enzyme required for sulfatase activity